MQRFLIATAALLLTASIGSAQDIPLSKILVDGQGWKTEAKTKPGAWKLTYIDGENAHLAVFREGQIWALHQDGKMRLYLGLAPQEMMWANAGVVDGYIIDSRSQSVGCWNPPAQALKINDIAKPQCLVLWPSKSQLVIGDAGGKYLWTARIEKDGSLSSLDRYYSVALKPGEKTCGVKAMVMDAKYMLYAATPLGVQVFDPTGRLIGIIAAPAKEEMTAITLGGKNADQLFVACGDKIYSRKIQNKAVYTLKKDK